MKIENRVFIDIKIRKNIMLKLAMSKVIKGNINKAKFVIEIPQYDGTYTNYKFNSLEELTNEWNQYIRIRPFYKITYVTFDYNFDGHKSEHIFNTNYTDKKDVVENLKLMMNYPIFHIMDKNGNKVYYKNYEDISYMDTYDNSNLHHVSEYVSVDNLLCSYAFFSTQLRQPKKYLTVTISSMPGNEVIASKMFEYHTPNSDDVLSHNITVTMCKNFTPLPDIEYRDNKNIDFVEKNYSAIQLGNAYFINAELELDKDKNINFMKVDNSRLLNVLKNDLDEIQILYITVDDKKTKWYRYFKPVNRLSNSVCMNYMEEKSSPFAEFCEKYKPFYTRISKGGLLLVPTIQNIDRFDKIYKKGEIVKSMYWNKVMNGWTSSIDNEPAFMKYNLERK
jgi:hypothetical protein